MEKLDLSTYESQIEYSHFTRMLQSIIKQPEYLPSGGAVIWFLLYHGRRLIWHFAVKRNGPLLFTIESDKEVIGGFTLSKSGEIMNAIITTNPMIKREAIRLFIKRIDQLILQFPLLKLRTFDTNTSIIRAALHRGFVISPVEEYVITLPLGPFTFSWISKTKPSHFVKLLRIRTLKLLVLQSDIMHKEI